MSKLRPIAELWALTTTIPIRVQAVHTTHLIGSQNDNEGSFKACNTYLPLNPNPDVSIPTGSLLVLVIGILKY